MAAEKIVTDEVMEFLRSEVFNAYATGDVLSYTAKDGTEYSLRITQVFGTDDPEFNDGFHAFATVLLDANGDETDQSVFVTRGSNAYPDCYADMDGNACGWPIFMERKDEVLSWYNDQKDAGQEVSFTGVSLGGVLSQMFAGFIHQETGDTLKSVVTFSAPGIKKSVTYEGETYDFSGTIAETVHHYLDSGDTMMQMGSYYIKGDIYLYGNNYYLDQAGDSGKVVRFKDYWLKPHSLVKYLLSNEYSTLPQAVFIKEMSSSEMEGSWSPLSVTVDEVPEGIENTNNAVVTVGGNTYLFNKAYAEITLTMAVSNGTVDVNYASKYVPRQKWEEMRGTEEGRQDFLGTAFFWDYTSDVNVGISGSFSQGGKDYAVITLTGKTDQGKEFLYGFSDGCFLETGEIITGGNWQDVAGAQTYTVKFDELPSASESSAEQSGSSQNKTYSTEVTNEMIEGIQFCAFGEHKIGDVFEYTSQAGLTYRVKYTELYGSDDPEMNDGFHAAGLVLLDTDGVTETDEHILIFRGTSGFPDAIADFYKDALGLPLFAVHTQDVLNWYEKYEGEKITFTGASLGSALSQYYAGWLVNDEGKDKLTRLVTFLPPAIVKEATYENTTYHFITDETVAETVDYYRQDGDIVFGFGQYLQKGTLHLYGGNAQFDQAEGIKLDEYISHAHESGTYLTGGTSALTYLGDFDTDYFAKDANYSDLAVEVDAVPEGLENTNVKAVTCGDKIYLFNTEYADVALTVVSYDIANYDETLEDFFEDASLYACRNQWETCRGADKQEALARLILYNNTSDIEISATDVTFHQDGDVYVVLEDHGTTYHNEDFLFNFAEKKFVAMKDVASDIITKTADGSVTLDLDDRTVVIDSSETEFETYNLTQKYTTWESAKSDDIVSGGIIQQQCEANKTVAIQAVEDHISDVIFAKASGTWGGGYIARHVGSGDWTGTRETVSLNGLNRISDLYFAASTDTCSVYLTDDANGDALFLDDIYTVLPDEIQSQQARVLNVDKFYAGAGDDIIDLTSQRYRFSANSIEIHGGEGNDHLWAASSSAVLLGEEGDDRLVGSTVDDVLAGGIGNDSMNGGGGDDIFTFCDNWGSDTVEQLANGSVTLWFKSGSEDNWDQSTMTYTDGENSVKVSGVSEVTLKFGSDETKEYAALAASGCFLEESSENIFDDTGKGVLA